jgi:hypothetical protein
LQQNLPYYNIMVFSPEMAGEGIEYIWVMAKLYYRRQSLNRKRTMKQFRQLVDECLSNRNVTLERACMCSRRACEYIIKYRAFHKTLVSLCTNGSGTYNDIGMNYELVEKTIQTYKSHRNVKDFDVKFIKGLCLDNDKVEFIKTVVCKMKTPG